MGERGVVTPKTLPVATPLVRDILENFVKLAQGNLFSALIFKELNLSD